MSPLVTALPVEVNFRRKDGTTLPVEVNGTISPREGGKVVQIIARDLTEKKEAEYKLKKTMPNYSNRLNWLPSENWRPA